MHVYEPYGFCLIGSHHHQGFVRLALDQRTLTALMKPAGRNMAEWVTLLALVYLTAIVDEQGLESMKS
jgi:hypothetical protein